MCKGERGVEAEIEVLGAKEVHFVVVNNVVWGRQ